jgi:hypothetical protein
MWSIMTPPTSPDSTAPSGSGLALQPVRSTSPPAQRSKLGFFRSSAASAGGRSASYSAASPTASSSKLAAAAAPSTPPQPPSANFGSLGRRTRRSLTLPRKLSISSMLDFALPTAVEEVASSSSTPAPSPPVVEESEGPRTPRRSNMPLNGRARAFSLRFQRRLSVVRSTVSDPECSSASAPLPAAAEDVRSASPASARASSSDGSEGRRLSHRPSIESFQCRGLEDDEAHYSDGSAHYERAAMPGLSSGGAENDLDGLGMLTPRVTSYADAMLRMQDFTFAAYDEQREKTLPAVEPLFNARASSNQPSALSLRRRSPSRLVTPPSLSSITTPARPPRPDSIRYVSPAPSSVATFSVASSLSGHDGRESMDGDDAASLVSYKAVSWTACPPTPPSSLRLRLRFFGRLPNSSLSPPSPSTPAPMSRSRSASDEQIVPTPLSSVFIPSCASGLELRELLAERLATKGITLSPRSLSVSLRLGLSAGSSSASPTTPTALGLAFGSPADGCVRQLDNIDALYEQGLLDDDEIDVCIRPTYESSFF